MKGTYSLNPNHRFQVNYKFTQGGPTKHYLCEITFPGTANQGTKQMESWELKAEGTIRDGSIHGRLAEYRTDLQAKAVLARVVVVRDMSQSAFEQAEATINEPGGGDPDVAKAEVRRLREEVQLLAGVADATVAADTDFLTAVSVETAGDANETIVRVDAKELARGAIDPPHRQAPLVEDREQVAPG